MEATKLASTTTSSLIKKTTVGCTNNTTLASSGHKDLTNEQFSHTFLDLSKNAFLISSMEASDFTPRSS